MPPLIGASPERMLEAIMAHAPTGIVVVSAPDMTIAEVSAVAAHLFGRPREELRGQLMGGTAGNYVIRRGDDDHLPALHELPIMRAILNGEVVSGEEWVVEEPDGSRVVVLNNSAPVRDENGNIVGGISAWADISRRKAVEMALRVALDNEYVLMREMSHRIKNHFQIIMGVIQMEAANLGGEAAEFAEAVIGRLSALAAAQEGISSSERFGEVHGEVLLRGIAQALDSSRHPVTVAAEPGIILVDGQVTPVSLAVNEAVSNAIKHAYPGGRPGEIRLWLGRMDGRVRLTVADDGVGLTKPADDTSLGMKILGALAHQLDGTFRLENRPDGGAVFTLDFPERRRAEAGRPEPAGPSPSIP